MQRGKNIPLNYLHTYSTYVCSPNWFIIRSALAQFSLRSKNKINKIGWRCSEIYSIDGLLNKILFMRLDKIASSQGKW